MLCHLCNSYICVREYKASPFSLIYGTEATSVLDLCLPEGPDNVHKTMKQAHNHWIENLTLLRKLARENMICSKPKTKDSIRSSYTST